MLFIDTNIYTYVPVTKCRGDSKHKHQKVPMYRYWKLSVIYFIHCVRERKQALHVLLTCWHYTQLFHFPLALLEINKSTYQIALFLCCPLDNPTAPSKNKYLNLESRWGCDTIIGFFGKSKGEKQYTTGIIARNRYIILSVHVFAYW